MERLAYVVSSHGFGHAARSCAVVDALWRRRAGLHVDFFAGTPGWFFEQSLGPASGDRPYEVHGAQTDLGLVQASALREDLPATVRELEARLPLAAACAPLAEAIQRSRADLVVCDISPWGLAAAGRLGLPSVLVENFTWDWIYEGYEDLHPYVADFRRLFEGASLRIRTEPVCGPAEGDVRSHPVSREPRTPRRATRELLGVGEGECLVMLTMGGVPWNYEHLQALSAREDPLFLIAGGAGRGETEARRLGRHWLLPHRSRFYHPDLVHASDVVVGKLGYSTVSEIAAAGAQFAYVPRPRFPESAALEAWVVRHLPARRIEPEDVESPDWLARVRRTVGELREVGEERSDGADTVGPGSGGVPKGAGQVAEAILRFTSQKTVSEKMASQKTASRKTASEI